MGIDWKKKLLRDREQDFFKSFKRKGKALQKPSKSYPICYPRRKNGLAINAKPLF